MRILYLSISFMIFILGFSLLLPYLFSMENNVGPLLGLFFSILALVILFFYIRNFYKDYLTTKGEKS
jgi:hypothetical protein